MAHTPPKGTCIISYKMLTAITISLLGVGLYAGYIIWATTSPITFLQRRANDPNLVYTNPLLSCGISENTQFSEYKSLEKAINDKIKNIDPRGLSTVSVYYKDFTSGRWFGINETATYSPASLLKVPIMIAYLKEAQSNPAILSERIYYNGTTSISNAVENYKSNKTIQAGNSYTVDQLISYMVENSDNAATVLLFQNINNNSLIEVMTDIGLKPPSDNGTTPGTDDYLSVKSYSFLFRLLYNSTYLNRDMSEKALKLLSQSDFSQGITQGFPSSIKSAHKFGERTVLDPSGSVLSRELHDCGVVYEPGHPYLLCVMTKGQSFDTLSAIIAGVSGTVYANLSKK